MEVSRLALLLSCLCKGIVITLKKETKMKKLIAFFEIPATDFRRAVDFYETVLNMKLPVFECEHYGSVFYVLVVDCEFIKTHYDD